MDKIDQSSSISEKTFLIEEVEERVSNIADENLADIEGINKGMNGTEILDKPLED